MTQEPTALAAMCSPPPRPPIPLQMAGGRPQPGNQMRRPGTPTPWDGPFAPADFAAVAGDNPGRAYAFTFESAATLGTVAHPSTPTASADGAQVAGPAATPSCGVETADAPTTTTTTATAAARWVPAMTIPGAGSLYGRPYAVGQGNLHYETSPRMDTW